MALALAGAGCARRDTVPSDAAKEAKPVATPPAPERRRVQVGEGDALRTTAAPERRKLFSVRWQRARLDIEGNRPLAGEMEDVTGQIFAKGKAVADYRADRAVADRDRQRLWLRGAVRVVATDGESTLVCDELEYDATGEIGTARGSVRMEGRYGVLSGAEVLRVNAGLTRAGTPAFFDR